MNNNPDDPPERSPTATPPGFLRCYDRDGVVGFFLQPMPLCDYLAAHAPEVPEWFPRKTEQCEGYRHGDTWCNYRYVETMEEHFFRWRWYYADAMLRAREGKP